jgi:hypothetical protein
VGGNFFLLGVGEAKFRFCSLGNVAFVWIWIVLSWGRKYLWILLFLNMVPNLPLCQERQEGIRTSKVYILRTKTRELMNKCRISGTVVVVTIIFDSLGGFNVNV